MAIYRTTKALSKKGGIIPTGGRVSSSHPRFNEGVKGGWIVKDGKEAKESKTPVFPSSSEETKKEVEIIPTVVPQEAFYSEPEAKPTGLEEVTEGALTGEEIPSKNPSPMIDELEFLGRTDESALLEESILQVSDLQDWNVDRLMRLRGIGMSKATQLMDVYDAWLKETIGSSEA